MLIGVVVVAAVVAAGVMVWRMDPGGGNAPSQADLHAGRGEIPPEMILYAEQAAPLATGLARATCLALDGGGRIYVGGAANVVRVFAPDGKKLRDIALDDAPRALAVTADGTLYVALASRVAAYDSAGKRLAAWGPVEAGEILTSLAPTPEYVFAASVLNRQGRVRRYRRSDGKLLTKFDGRSGGGEKDVGLVVPSPYLDLAVSGSFLWVVNPGRRRVEAYDMSCGMALDPDGQPLRWGKSGQRLGEFCGCCNPAHIAALPGGGFVTAEKGYTRVSVYDKAGRFEGIVGGPKQFATHDEAALGKGAGGADIRALEVAADKAGVVFVLDPATAEVRRFVRKTPAPKTQPAP